MTAEEMLRAPAEQIRTYDSATWNILVRHVIDGLIEWLGYKIEVDPPEGWNVGLGFSLHIIRAYPSANDLIHWKGILGATIIENSLRVSLDAFFYSGTHRLRDNEGAEFVEYVYEPRDSTKGKWELFGWFMDEYDEYAGFHNKMRCIEPGDLKSSD